MTRKLPSTTQGGRVSRSGSPVWPNKMMPGWMGLGPGSGFLSNPMMAGFEMPSRKPKLKEGRVETVER